MKCSPARLAANRANAALSTGPKTPRGKEIARGNALKHGLTGAGIVLPGEDKEVIEERYDALVRDFSPRTEREVILVHRAAYLSVRLLRCERYDHVMLSDRTQQAIADFDQERADQLSQSIQQLASEPELIARELRSDPDGLDWMIERHRSLRIALASGDGLGFGTSDLGLMLNLMGRYFDPSEIDTQEVSLFRAVANFYGDAIPADVSDEAKPAWARRRLLTMVDREIGILSQERMLLDTTDILRERAKARDRALFDPSKDATLARRYEAATDREMRKIFRELDELAAAEVEVASVEPEAPAEPEVMPKGRGSVASFFPTPEKAPEAREKPQFASTSLNPIVSTGRPEVETAVIPPRIE